MTKRVQPVIGIESNIIALLSNAHEPSIAFGSPAMMPCAK